MATQWDNWWKAYKKANPKAVINEATRDKFRAWQSLHCFPSLDKQPSMEAS